MGGIVAMCMPWVISPFQAGVLLDLLIRNIKWLFVPSFVLSSHLFPRLTSGENGSWDPISIISNLWTTNCPFPRIHIRCTQLHRSWHNGHSSGYSVQVKPVNSQPRDLYPAILFSHPLSQNLPLTVFYLSNPIKIREIWSSNNSFHRKRDPNQAIPYSEPRTTKTHIVKRCIKKLKPSQVLLRMLLSLLRVWNPW